MTTAVRTEPLVRLDLNVAPFLNEGAIERALRAATSWDLAMYPEPGAPRLEAAIAAKAEVPPDCVLVGNGSDELLDLVMRALLPRARAIGVLDPSFGMYDHFARANRLEARRFPAKDTLPVDALAASAADGFFLPSPNNPTGTAFPREAFEALLDRVSVPVVIDEAYAEFARTDLRPLAAERPNVLVTRTFSKAYGLPGIRVGYLLGPVTLVARLREIRMPYNLSAWGERVALAALEDGAFVERAVAYVERERERLLRSLREGGWPVWPSRASFLFVGPLLHADKVRGHLRERGIVVKRVDWPGGASGGCLRISVGTEEQNARFLAALEGVDPCPR